MANTGKTPCECGKFEAVDEAQLTEANLESGNYETFDTGCQAETSRTFAPGHDARLKSHLIRWGALGLSVGRSEGGVRVDSDAQSWADKYEFGYMVKNGIAKAVEKAQAKAQREADRVAKKAAKGKPAERKLAESAGVVADETTHDGNAARKEREAKALSLAEIVKAEEAAHAEAVKRSQPEPEWDDEPAQPAKVSAKIGRWTYEGTVGEGGAFWYTDKKGKSKMAKEGDYKLV